MVSSKEATFIVFAVFLSLLVFLMLRARVGKLPYIRRVAGLDAIEEAVGRATELGRPVFYVPGRTEINTGGPLRRSRDWKRWRTSQG